MIEEWREIEGYEGLYMVSNQGRVKSLVKWHRILKPLNQGAGYYSVILYKDRIARNFLVHRLVANAFIPNPENKPCIDHIDCNRHNNIVSNLKWCTHKENSNNVVTLKKIHDNNPHRDKFGKDSQSHIPVICIETGALYYGTCEASRKTGIDPSSIAKVCRNEKYFKTAGGYHWRYATDEEKRT